MMFKFLGLILAEICLKYIILVTNFQKLQALGALRPQRPLIFDFCDLKLRDVAKLCFFKLIMMKSNFKNQLWRHFSDVIAITSPKNVTKITSQNFSIYQNFWLHQW